MLLRILRLNNDDNNYIYKELHTEKYAYTLLFYKQYKENDVNSHNSENETLQLTK